MRAKIKIYTCIILYVFLYMYLYFIYLFDISCGNKQTSYPSVGWVFKENILLYYYNYFIIILYVLLMYIVQGFFSINLSYLSSLLIFMFISICLKGRWGQCCNAAGEAMPASHMNSSSNPKCYLLMCLGGQWKMA